MTRQVRPREGQGVSSSAPVETFDSFFSWPAAGLFALVYLAGIANSVVGAIVVLGLLAWSLAGAKQAMMAMSCVALLKFANPAVASPPLLGAVLFWLVAMTAAGRLYMAAGRFSAPFVFLVAFALAAILLSAMVSKAVDVSVMKVVSFFIVSSSLLLASNSLRSDQVLALQRWFFSVVLVMAALSLLTLPFPGVAFNTVAGSLQGMFSHPQTAGVFYVPFAAWLIARIFLERWALLPRWVIALAVVFAGMIVATGARTAMLATFVSVGLTLVLFLVRGRTGPANRTRGQIVGFSVAMLLFSAVILFSGVLQEEVEAIVYKGDEETASVTEAFEASRGAGVAMHIDNFLDAPLTGHGFGVYREGVRGGERNIVRFMGIPISASAEKGIIFTAVLEEVGLFGGLLFYGLLISIIAAAAKASTPGVLAMVIGTLAVNFGEAIFFATGGMGLFMWAMIGFGLARARIEQSQ